MPAKKPDELDAVIRAKKFEQAIEYVTVLEQHRKRILAEISTTLIQVVHEMNTPALVQSISNALVALSKQGLADNLIQEDLARVRDSLGPGYVEMVTEMWVEIQRTRESVVDHCEQHPDDPNALVAAAKLGDEVLGFISLLLLPARELLAEMRTAAEKKARPPSDTKRRKQIRDLRIKELSKELGTKSPAKIRDAGKQDSIIHSVCPPEPFDAETVRNVLTPRRTRRVKKK